MKQVSLYDAKTHLSRLVEEAAAGEEIVIAKNGKPTARIVPLAAPEDTPRPRNFGIWAGSGWTLPENFNDPDPEIEALFYDGAGELPDDEA